MCALGGSFIEINPDKGYMQSAECHAKELGSYSLGYEGAIGDF